MGKRVTVVVAILALLPVPMATSLAASASVPRPTWAVGDYWDYNLNVTGANSGVTMRSEVVDIETLSLSSGNYSAYRLETTRLQAVPGLSYSHDQLFLVSDLALALDTQTLYAPSLGANDTSSVTYTPPPVLDWPLVTNGTWSASTVATMTSISPGGTSSFNLTESMEFSVGSEGIVKVPAGTFSVVDLKQVQMSGGFNLSTSDTYWSSSVDNFVWQVSSFSGEESNLTLVGFGHEGTGPNPMWLLLPVGIGAVAVAALWYWRSRTRGQRSSKQGEQVTLERLRR